MQYAEVHGNYYGTSIAGVAKVAAEGKICILDIDIQVIMCQAPLLKCAVLNFFWYFA